MLGFAEYGRYILNKSVASVLFCETVKSKGGYKMKKKIKIFLLIISIIAFFSSYTISLYAEETPLTISLTILTFFIFLASFICLIIFCVLTDGVNDSDIENFNRVQNKTDRYNNKIK